MLLRCRNTTNHLRKRRHLHNAVLRATIICRKCQKAPREPKKNEFRIAYARKRENRFCTVAPLTCNPFNPNWISRHLEGTASCTRKSRSRGGTVENVLLSRFCSPLELASFHVYMLAPFLPIAMKLGRVVIWSIVYNCVKR